MRIVVTGASGNVGSQLLPQLLSAPEVTSVVGIARRPPADRDVEWHALDIAQDDLGPALRGADAVIHLAWLLQPAHHPAEMARVNVTGTRKVIDAVTAEDVPVLIHASSVGAYSPGPRDRRVTEQHPTGGIPSSTYSTHKSIAEQMLDAHEQRHPQRRVVRMRPGVVLQADAASELARYFLGPMVPRSLLRRAVLRAVPDVPRLAIQAVHGSDLAAAYVTAVTKDVRGAFNIASEPVLDPGSLAEALGAARVPVPLTLVRGLVDLSWRLRLQTTDPGWVDLGTQSPLLDTSRARTLLDWAPQRTATDALLEVIDAMGRGRGGATPVLRPRAKGLSRLGELITTGRG